MYQNIFISKKDSTVHLWDDMKGYVKFPYQPYAYRKRNGGMYKSIYGDELEQVTELFIMISKLVPKVDFQR
jgi:hypothetical protein